MEKQFKVDKLSVHLCEDKILLGRAAADYAEKYIVDAIAANRRAIVILATGASQFEFLDSLTQRRIQWNKVIAFHLDEYVGLPQTHGASFRRYLHERIVDKVGIGTFYAIEGDKGNSDEECMRLDRLLRQHPVDAAFIGIGENTHLAFNDPPARFDDTVKYKTVTLTTACRQQQVGEGWFTTLNDVPNRAITMTIPAILDSKAIICSVPDARKAEAVRLTLTKPISPNIPASILRVHPEASLFLDRHSASLLDDSVTGSLSR